MSDIPKDPGKAGQRGGFDPLAAKKPSATLDLRATEIERRDMPGSDTIEAAATAEAPKEETVLEAKISAPPPPPKAPLKPARQGSAFGRFVSHLAAGVAGAAVAIFGADYAANTFGFSIPTYSAGQMEQIARRMGALEQEAKEKGVGTQVNLLKEQFESLKAKLDQTASTASALPALQAAQKEAAARALQIEQLAGSKANAAEVIARLAKLEDQFKTLADAGASGKGGSPAQVAALVAKFDAIGNGLDAQLAEMRKGLAADVQKQTSHFEDRLREIDKGMSVESVKAGNKALGESIAGIKAEAGRLGQDIAALAEGNKEIRAGLGALKQSTESLKAQMEASAGSFAKTAELSSVNAAAAKLQADLAAIAARDKNREDGAGRILLALQLANLKRVAERGIGFQKELAEVKRLAPKDLDLSALEASAEKGLPTSAALAGEFKDLTWSVVNAGAPATQDGSLIGQLWQGASSIVQVRKTGEVTGNSAEATVARTEARLAAGDLEGALAEANKLTGDARKAADPWIARLGQRLALDQAIAAIDASLSRLMGPAPTVN